MRQLFADVRLALRRLRNAPIFTLFAVASLALGIGVSTAVYSADYFSVMQLALLLGRLPGAPDQRESAHVVVVSERYWRQQLRADRDVVGGSLRLGGLTFEIVGVVRGSFHGLDRFFTASVSDPCDGAAARRAVDVWSMGRPDQATAGGGAARRPRMGRDRRQRRRAARLRLGSGAVHPRRAGRVLPAGRARGTRGSERRAQEFVAGRLSEAYRHERLAPFVRGFRYAAPWPTSLTPA